MKNKTRSNRMAPLLLLASVFILSNSTPSFASYNECEPLFNSEIVDAPTPIDSGLISLDNPVAIKANDRGSERNSVDLIPQNTRLRGLKFSNWVLPKSAKDPNFQASLNELLDMMTETHFENVDPKMTNEKGEMHLARSIGDGQTVEFEYRRDSRRDSFRLDKIVLFKPNGQSITLDKSPVSDSGLRLNREQAMLVESTEVYEGKAVLASLHPLDTTDLAQWAEGNYVIEEILKKKKGADASSILQGLGQELSSADQSMLQRIASEPELLKVPIVIEGDLLKEISNWANRMPELPRGKVQAAIKANHVTRLVWSARISASIKLLVSTTRKQFAKWVVIGAILVGVQHVPGVYEHAKNVMPGHVISKMVQKPTELTPDQSVILAELLKKLQAGAAGGTNAASRSKVATVAPSEAANPVVALPNVPDINSQAESVRVISNFSETISQLSADEKAQGGQMVFFLSDLTNHTVAPIAAGAIPTAQGQTKSGYVIAVFAKTQKLILAPITQAADSTLPKIATVIIDRQGHEQLYDTIANTLTH